MLGFAGECRCAAGTLLAITCLVAPAGGQQLAGPKEEARAPWQRQLDKSDQTQADLLQMQIDAAIQDQKWDAALHSAEKLVQLRQKVQGADHWQTLDERIQLQTLRRVASLKPEEHERDVLAGQQQREALALIRKGQARQAQGLFEEVLDTRRQLLGDDHPLTGASYHNLACALQAQGKYKLAEKALSMALDIRRKALGDDHPDTTQSYIALAMLQHDQGKDDLAEKILTRAVDSSRKIVGNNHPDTGQCYHNLAQVHSAQGKYDLAEKDYAKALDIVRRARGDDHPNTVTTSIGLATVQYYQGKYDLAEQGLAKALGIRRKTLGDDHPDTANCCNILAAVYQAQGKYDLSEKGYVKALDIWRKALGDDHTSTAASYNNLALLHKAQGKYDLAEKGFGRSLDICRKMLGDDHRHTAVCYSNLALVHDDQGKYDLAERGYAKALAIKSKLQLNDHPDTARTYNNLASVHQAQGKYDLAEKGFAKALDITQKALGDDHPDTATSSNNLALLHKAQGKYDLAEKGYVRALDIRRKVLGDDHPDTATCYQSLASVHRVQGKYDLAEKEYARALAIRRKALGNVHPHTADSYNGLAFVHLAQSKYELAEGDLRNAARAFVTARLRSASAALDRAAFTSEHSSLLYLAAILARNGKAAEAWEHFEQSLAPSTRDELEARLRLSGPDRQRLRELTAGLDRLDSLLAPVSVLSKRPAPSEEQRQLWLQERLRTQDELGRLVRKLERAGGVSLPLEQVQQTLPADVALVAWIDFLGGKGAPATLEEHWAVVVRAKGEPAWLRLKGSGSNDAWTEADRRAASELSRAVQAASQSDAKDWRGLAARLTRQRLEPLRPSLRATADLPAVRHLVALPSGEMDDIPLEVLTTDFTISTVPSASLFVQLRQKTRPTSKGVLALADPVFDAAKLPDLPHGLLITVVGPKTNAQEAGLQAGDVLLEYNGTPLKQLTDVKLLPPGDDPDARVAVQVWREGKTFTRRLRSGPLGVALDKQPAPEALAERRRIRKETLTLTRGNDSWRSLPGTRVEAEALRRMFEARKQPVELLTDSAASEQQLHQLATKGKLANFRYLHLATHGEMNPKVALQSALILAQDALPDDAETYRRLTAGEPIFDGRLTAREVLEGWQLDADLVVLSACESGLGKYESGEGFMGFAQAFLIVGSRSVLLSRWKVDDTATALLMSRFYRNLLGDDLAKPMTKRAALAEAQKWLREFSREEALRLAADLTKGVMRGKGRPPLPEKPAVPMTKGEDKPFAHPYYWAAFALVGDPD